MTLCRWAPPLVIATFLAAGVTGILMFFHLDVGVNKLLHEWIGPAMIAGVGAHVVLNWRPFTADFRRPLPRLVISLGVFLLAFSFAPDRLSYAPRAPRPPNTEIRSTPTPGLAVRSTRSSM